MGGGGESTRRKGSSPKYDKTMNERATEPFTNSWGEKPRFGWEAPGGIDRAGDGPEAHVLFAPERVHEAACKGFLDEVIWLLDKAPEDGGRVGVDHLDPGGRTPLHFACGWGREDIVRALIDRGATLEVRDMWKKAPVDWALQARHDRVVEILRIAAVMRGVHGGKGRVAPLSTMTEVVSGKTDDEVETDIKEFTCGVFEEYAKRDTVPEGHTFGGKVVDTFKEEA